MPRFTITEARAYLSRLVQRGAITTKKPMSDYSGSYVQRLAGSLNKQQAAGVPLSRQAARGHTSTPEHSGRAAPLHLPAAVTEYQRVHTRQARAGKTATLNNGGQQFKETKGKGDARQVAGLMANRSPSARVYIMAKDKDGRWATLTGKGGISQADYRSLLDNHRTWRGAIKAVWGAHPVYKGKTPSGFDISNIDMDSITVSTFGKGD